MYIVYTVFVDVGQSVIIVQIILKVVRIATSL